MIESCAYTCFTTRFFLKQTHFQKQRPMTPLFGGYGDLAYRWAGAANIVNIKTQPKKCIPYIPKTKPGCCLLGFYSILVHLYISVPSIPPIPCVRAAGNPCKNTGVLWGKGVNFCFFISLHRPANPHDCWVFAPLISQWVSLWGRGEHRGWNKRPPKA